MKFVITEKEITSELPYGTLNISSEEEEGFRPFQLLVSAVAGCSGLVFRRILMKQRLDIEYFTIEAKVERNEKEASRIEKIDLIFSIKGNDLDERKLERNLSITRKHCSMVRSVEDSIEITERLKIIE
ncbi:MAG TPA: OsmC family protein [Bacillota bacterium]|nr:OsmC family protein [Bacillota bacterium]